MKRSGSLKEEMDVLNEQNKRDRTGKQLRQTKMSPIQKEQKLRWTKLMSLMKKLRERPRLRVDQVAMRM